MIPSSDHLSTEIKSESDITFIGKDIETHDTGVNLSETKVNIGTETVNKNTVLDIEETATVNNTQTRQNVRKKYWIMFWASEPPQRKPQDESGWCPWGYGTPPRPVGPAPLNYKPDTRNSFVKLVLTIVLMMIITTALFIGYVLITPDVKDFFRKSGLTILLPAMGLLIIVDYGMICSPCTRKPPCNFIFLILAVVAMSLISAKITVHYKTEVLLYAVLATAAIVFVCVCLACSSFDFTSWILYVVVIATAVSAILLTVLLVKAVTGVMMKPVVLGILCVCTFIQAMLLTIQLQTILGGRTVQLNESDYALGAFMIYTSIVDIFLKMVQIIGISESM